MSRTLTSRRARNRPTCRGAGSPRARAGHGFTIEGFESLHAGGDLRLLRVIGRAPAGALPPKLVIEDGASRCQVDPLPDFGGTVYRVGDGGGDWVMRAGYGVHASLLDGTSFSLAPSAGVRIELPTPEERDWALAGAEPQIVVRRGRPYMLVAVGLVTAMLVPLAVPFAAAGATDVPSAEVCRAQPLTAGCPTPGGDAASADSATKPTSQAANSPAATPPATPPAPAPAPPTTPAKPATPPPADPTPPQPPVAAAPAPAPVAPAPAPAPVAKKPAPTRAPSKRADAKPDQHDQLVVGPQTRDGAAAPGPRGQSPHRSKPSHTRAAPPAAPTAPSSTGPSSLGPLPTLSLPGSPPVGVPGFFIERFRIPPFLLPIYQAAGIQYGIPWQVLAAINEIETDYGRNLNVSTAGALGWMQFMPGTWRTYGVDANADGRRDPYNPADAIFAAARYLRAAGGDRDLRSAIFSYNHANWYVSSVLMRAKLIGGMPPALIDALTGLTEGRFPVAARAHYAGDEAGSSRADVRARASDASASADRTSVQIYARPGAPVVAVNDGVVTRIGDDRLGGRYVVLQDVYGNAYRYSALGAIARTYPYPRPLPVTSRAVRRELHLPAPGAHPSEPASSGRHAGTQVSRPAGPERRLRAHASHPAGLVASSADVRPAAQPTAQPRLAAPTKERLFAHPKRPGALAAGGLRQLGDTPVTGAVSSYDRSLLRLKADQVVMRRLTRGSHVIAGTVLGRVGRPAGSSSTATVADPTAPRGFDPIDFEIRPAGPKAPRIDPKPILDGWRLLASTAIYGPSGNSALTGTRRGGLSIGQILLMDKSALARRVLSDSAIKIYDCGRRDIRSGQIDRRVLATLEYLVANGLDPTVSALKCGHSYLTTSGNVSEHSSGDAVDIAAINGIPIAGHQGAGSITERTIRRLLMLQGNMKPHQIISLMTFAGTDNTLALPDHADHIHVGFRPAFGPNQRLGHELDAVLKPGQWTRLMQRLDEIQNPVVPLKPSRYALPDGKGNGD